MPEWLFIVLRSVALLFLVYVIARWIGNKQLSQFNQFEYISGIVLGVLLAIHSVNLSWPLTYGLIAIFIWFIIPFTLDYLSLKSKRLRDTIHGKSTVIIQDGKIMEDNLKKKRYTTDDLLENLRTKDIFKTADVEFAILEPSGALNVLTKKEAQPPTIKDLDMQVNPEKEPQTVVMDGRMLLEPLANLSLNPNWLETELDKINVSIENVFLAQVDSSGQLTVDLYDDKIAVPNPTEKPLLLATLKKCQADLELFALETENEQSKAMYEANSKKLQKTIDMIMPYLK